MAVASVVLVSGCSSETRHEWNNLAMPDPASEQATHIFELWRWSWVAAMVTGVITWALIFWVMYRYRRRSEDEVPTQTRYNLPLEIFYTIAPVIMVVVFFVHTLNTQNAVLDDKGEADHTFCIVGQQWSWTFNYADCDATGEVVYEAGTASYIPTLVMPVGETTEFQLRSPDVIHDLGVPAFLMKMDVVPGRDNHYRVTPTELGEYKGFCYELCGFQHSRMLFNVKVVSVADYEAYLTTQAEAGNVNPEGPIMGGEYAYTQAGLTSEEGGEE